MTIVRRKFLLAGSEAEKLAGTHSVLNDLPMEHHIRGNNRLNTVVRRREVGYRTVAYPGGVMKVYEAIHGQIPAEHRVHPEGLEAYYLPEMVAPPEFSQPLILSDFFTIPASAANFPTIQFTVPIGREATVEKGFFGVADASLSTIKFTIQYGGLKSQFASDVTVSAFESYRAGMRLDEQMKVGVLVTNLLPGIRTVQVILNGWIYPIRKKMQ